jgi:putative transposase
MPSVNTFWGVLGESVWIHLLILSEKQLHRVLRVYVAYFNKARPHQGIQQHIPELPVPSAPRNNQREKMIAVPVLGRLYHGYRRLINAIRRDLLPLIQCPN